MIYMRIDQIMIKEMLGVYEVGIYSAAVRLSEGFYFIPVLISTSVFPAIIYAKNMKLYKVRLQSLYTLLVWIAIALASITTFFGKDLILLFYGQSYNMSGDVLIIHGWASIFVFLGVASGKWFIVQNLQRLTLINTCIGAILNVSLNFIFLPIFGIVGAAYATVVSQCFAAYFMNAIWKASRPNFLMLSKSLMFRNLLWISHSWKKILSERVRIYIANFINKHINDYAIKSYSQEGEDMILKRIFEKQSLGFYVDVEHITQNDFQILIFL